MFTPSNQSSKLDVLESKLNIYEQLSREMLDKLESAVDKISESNARIATILAKHDERIEQNIKNDELLIRMIEDMKNGVKEDLDDIDKRIDNLEKQVDELSKFRWQVGGITAVAVIIVGVVSTLIPTYLTNSKEPVRMESPNSAQLSR